MFESWAFLIRYIGYSIGFSIITVVIDKKSVLGGHTDHDITNIIIEKLNKELPSLNLK